MKKPLLIIALVLLLDQAFKFWVKTNMYLGQEFSVLGNWFIIHFTENNGMAFGMEFEGAYGKIFLSLFRILAVAGIGWFLYDIVRKKAHPGFIVSLSLIFAGALGNIIDSVFYGKIFNESYGQLATFLPEEGGYGDLLHGKVVDMLYFPLIHTQYPSWVPFFGGEEFVFFRPVFNIADSAICIGVFMILLFQKRYFAEEEKKEGVREDTNNSATDLN